jgi:hypothetical protein
LHDDGTHPQVDVTDISPDVIALFALLDEMARGLAREAALDPEERAARADAILAWFAPRYAALKAAAAGAPCPVPWTVHLADPAADSPDPDPHPCTDCFTQRYRAWERSHAAVGGPASG